MAQIRVNITRDPGAQEAEFVPAAVSVTSQDNLFWTNNDTESAHQPAPSLSSPNGWMPAPISAKLEGQPAPSSRALAFNTPQKDQQGNPIPYTINYVCALHDQETGTITVTE